ncbi:MAG: hypothetical protein NAOJABEB_00526 [Steroidobacteraceae bacterium]|nr:hypothetical protein [Steroidobacteraceae bacterium]
MVSAAIFDSATGTDRSHLHQTTHRLLELLSATFRHCSPIADYWTTSTITVSMSASVLLNSTL